MLVIFMTIMVIFTLRLAYVQLVATHHISKYEVDLVEESIKQRTQTFVLHSGRGSFTDRYGRSLHMESSPSLILFPFLKEYEWPVADVARIINIDEKRLLEAIANHDQPFVFTIDGARHKLSTKQMKQINELKISGVYAQYVQERTENLAPHLIGVIGENVDEVKKRYDKQIEKGTISIHSQIGVSGMQRSLDPFLISQGSSSLAYFVDNLGRPMFGFDIRYSAPADPYYPTEVRTTIDGEIQSFVTKTLQEVGISKGGVVILDAKTNDLLSLVSVPSFNIQFPFGEGAKNQLITAQTPGSIFKIVVAAAAIELNLINKFDLFDCSKDLYGENEEPRKLGKLNFQESFAQSCNYTFSQLATELLTIDKEVLNKYAQKLGLVEKVGWIGDIYRLENIQHFPEEEAGTIVLDMNKDIGDRYSIAQTSIGQKNVQVTPLAVANMLANIIRGGEKFQVRAATKINYENGTTVVEFPRQKLEGNDQISIYTSMRLQELLRSVVKHEKGTAYPFLHNSPYEIAGKTGTAQKGINNSETSHWFAGYFPATDPKYVMVIIDLNHQSGNMKTLKAYNKIVNFLYELDV